MIKGGWRPMGCHILSRFVLPCCALPLGIVLLVIAAHGMGGAQDAPGEPVDPKDGTAEVELPADVPREAGLDPDLLGEKPKPGEEAEEAAADSGVPEVSSEERWWSLMGNLAPELPTDDALGDAPLAGSGLFGVEPDAFEDLALPLGPMGLGGSPRNLEAYDAGIRRSELLPLGFQSPLERQGFRFGVGVQGVYDSNLYLDDMEEVGDFALVVSPTIEYRSAPAGVPGLVTFRYTPFLRQYLDETDLNTIDHSADGSVGFTGTRGNFLVAANYGRISNADRNFRGRKETESFGLRASAAYQIAARTSLEANFSARRSSDTDQARAGEVSLGSSDDDTLQFQLAGYWQATAKSRFGPSVRYSQSSADTTGDRDAMAFLMVADYVPRDELSFSASLGVEQVTDDSIFGQDSTDMTGSFGVNYRPNDRIALAADLSYQAIPPGRSSASRTGGGQQSFTGGLSFTYTPNPVWSMGLGLSADAYPSVDSANYSIGEQSFTSSVTRRLPQGSLSLSGTLGSSSYDATGAFDPSRPDQQPDQDFYSAALRYQRPMFAERGTFHSSLQWSENSGGNQDWSRVQFALGMDIGF